VTLKKCPRRNKPFHLGLDPRELHLPWAVSSLPARPARVQAASVHNARAAGVSCGRASVSVRVAGAGTRRGGGISGIAKPLSACGR